MHCSSKSCIVLIAECFSARRSRLSSTGCPDRRLQMPASAAVACLELTRSQSSVFPFHRPYSRTVTRVREQRFDAPTLIQHEFVSPILRGEGRVRSRLGTRTTRDQQTRRGSEHRVRGGFGSRRSYRRGKRATRRRILRPQSKSRRPYPMRPLVCSPPRQRPTQWPENLTTHSNARPGRRPRLISARPSARLSWGKERTAAVLHPSPNRSTRGAQMASRVRVPRKIPKSPAQVRLDPLIVLDNVRSRTA